MKMFDNGQQGQAWASLNRNWDIRADIKAGVPSDESEAARRLFKRYPGRPNAERFYEIWE